MNLDTTVNVTTMILEIEDELRNPLTHTKAEQIEFYKNILNILKKEQKILDVKKFDFKFFGKKGIGKTTSILRLFNLLRGEKELLTTGSGGTTVCEVEIRPAIENNICFEIIPEDEKQLQSYLDDFCLSFKPDKKEDEKNLYVPNEISRFFYNMIGINKKGLKEKYNEFNEHIEFVNFVHDKLQLDKRKETIIDIAYNDQRDYFDSATEIFELLNLGKIPTVTIPKKIILYVPDNILNFDNYEIINSITDTRGTDKAYEGETNIFRRPDVLAHIENKETESLYFFVDDFNSILTDSIAQFFKDNIRNKEHAERFYLIINTETGQPENVIGDNGRVSTKEEGYEHRYSQIVDVIEDMGLNFLPEHILFYNSKMNEPSNMHVLQLIKEQVEKFKIRRLENCQLAYDSFIKMKYDFENLSLAKEKIQKLEEEFFEQPKLSNLTEDVVKNLISRIERYYAASIDKMNRYSGHYLSDSSFYHELRYTIEDLYNDIYMSRRLKVEDELNNIIKYRSIDEIDKFQYRELLKNFTDNYAYERLNLANYIRTIVANSYSNEVWEKAASEFGKGKWPEGSFKKASSKHHRLESSHVLSNLELEKLFIDKWLTVFRFH